MPCRSALKARVFIGTLRRIATAMLLISWGLSSESVSSTVVGTLLGTNDLEHRAGRFLSCSGEACKRFCAKNRYWSSIANVKHSSKRHFALCRLIPAAFE